MIEENKTHVGPSSHHRRAGVASDCHTAVLLQAVKEPRSCTTRGSDHLQDFCGGRRRELCLAADQTRWIDFITFIRDGFLDGAA